MKENNYIVEVNFMGEAISLSARNEEEAIKLAKDIISEEYSDSVAGDATYKISV